LNGPAEFIMGVQFRKCLESNLKRLCRGGRRMKYIEIVGECELIYEGEPKEIAELQSLINPKVLTIKNDPLSNAAEHTKKLLMS
jgi:hypothetical protein